MFSLEELGKAETLWLRAVEAAADGMPRSVQDIMAGLTAHRTKLGAGRGPLTITAMVSFWGDIPAPGTTEAAQIERRLAEAERIARENAPTDTHRARMRALYVDIGEGDLWQTPAETTDEEAYLMLSAATIEYGERRRKFADPTTELARHVRASLEDRILNLPEAPDVNWPWE